MLSYVSFEYIRNALLGYKGKNLILFRGIGVGNGEYVLVEIVRIIVLAYRLLIGIARTFDLEGSLLIEIVRTIDFGACL